MWFKRMFFIDFSVIIVSMNVINNIILNFIVMDIDSKSKGYVGMIIVMFFFVFVFNIFVFIMIVRFFKFYKWSVFY